MKIQISFDITDLDQALDIAQKVAPFVDSLEIGSLLLYKYGVISIEKFKKEFPEKIIFVDAKIVDRSQQAISLFSHVGADWISVMAGTSKNVIHRACMTAHNAGKKIMLDLLDACSLGQSALEAKSLGVDALLLHTSVEEDDPLTFINSWDMVRGNSHLPIYVSGRITQDVIEKILAIKPDGVIIGKSITESENPADMAAFFRKSFD